MKKVLPLWVLLMLPIFLSAQIQYTVEDGIAPNDTAKYFTTEYLEVNYDAVGENVLWDFSDLVPIDLVFTPFGDPADAKTLFKFVFIPGVVSNVTEKLDVLSFIPENVIPDNFEVNGQVFYMNAEDELKIEGYGINMNDISFPARFQAPDVLLKYPVEYEQSYTNDALLDQALPGFGYLQIKRNRTTVVDGYGEIQTPLGTFEALRIKSDVVEYDSVYVDAYKTGMAFPREFTEYSWVSKDSHSPIAKLTIGEDLYVMTYSNLKKDIEGIDEQSTYLNQVIGIGPNPVVDFLNISFSESINLKSIQIYDIIGNLRNNEDVSAHFESGKVMNISRDELNLETGVYLIRLIAEEGETTRKLVVR